jgi:LPS-assembly protein
LAVLLATLPAASGQVFRPPFVAPPPPQNEPSPANPNLKLRLQRPGALGPNDVSIVAITQVVEGPLRHLRGHVHIETQEAMLDADEVDYNDDTKDAEARGNVHYENFANGDKIQCDHANYNIDTEQGKFYEVRGTAPAKIEAKPGVLTTSNPFYFEGKWAERTEDKYILYDGYVTDCKVPRPWWKLTGPKFDVIPGDRAVAYRTIFRLHGVPIMYMPVLYKSLKRSPRKSGFLTPNIGHSSRRGYMVGGGYFWAINRSYDMLYRGQYFTERGIGHNYDFRGKVRPGTDFNFALYGVNDKGLKLGTSKDANGVTHDVIQKQGGFLFGLQGRSELGHGWEARGELNYLSSYLFRQSFTESFHEAINSESHSVGFITKHWSTYGVTVSAGRDLEYQSVTPNDRIVIRKLPEVDFVSREHLLNDRVLPLWFSLDSSAGFLHRSEPDFQTRQYVTRVDLYPTLTTALRWKDFHLIPSFSLRETGYGSSLQNGVVTGRDIFRNAREVRVELIMPALARIYKAPSWMGDKVKHVIEPRAEYHLVDGVNNFNNVIRFDDTDVFSNTNELRVSVANRLFVKSKDGNVNEILSWEVSQSRYFDPTFGGAIVAGRRNVVESSEELTSFAFLDRARNYSPVTSIFRFQQRIGLEWRTDYDPLRGGITNSGLTADVRWSRYFVSAGHDQVRSDPVLSPTSNQFRGLVGIGNQNRKGWNAAFSAIYDYKRSIMQFSTTQVNYNTDCCGFSVQYRRFNIGTRDETQYRVAFAVSNIGTFGTLKKQERIF